MNEIKAAFEIREGIRAFVRDIQLEIHCERMEEQSSGLTPVKALWWTLKTKLRPIFCRHKELETNDDGDPENGPPLELEVWCARCGKEM